MGNDALNNLDPYGLADIIEVFASKGPQGGFRFLGFHFELNFGADRYDLINKTNSVTQGGSVGFGKGRISFSAGCEREAKGQTSPMEKDYYTDLAKIGTGQTYNDVLAGKEMTPTINIFGFSNKPNEDTKYGLIGAKAYFGFEVNINLSEIYRRMF